MSEVETMASEAILPPAVEPMAEDPIEKLIAQLRQTRNADWLQDEVNRIAKKIDTESKKAEENAAKDALKAKGVEFATEVQQHAKDIIEALGIVVPNSGLHFSMDIGAGEQGLGPVVNFSLKETAVRTRRTSGNASVVVGTAKTRTINQIEHLGKYHLVDGTEVESVSAVAKALGVAKDGYNQASVLVSAGLKAENLDKFNTVMVEVGDDLRPLGTLIQEHFGKKEAAAAAA